MILAPWQRAAVMGVSPWTPAAPGGLVGLWEPDSVTLTGSAVDAMLDKSGSGHPLLQSVAANKPTWVASGSLGLIRFDGTSDYLQSAAFATAQPCHVLIACATTDTGDTRYLFDGKSASTSLCNVFWGGGKTVKMYAGSYVTGPVLTSGAGCIVDAIYNGAASKIGLNGGTQTTGAAGATAFDGFTLCATGAGTLTSPTDVYGVMMYSGELSAAHRASAVSYLRAQAARAGVVIP